MSKSLPNIEEMSLCVNNYYSNNRLPTFSANKIVKVLLVGPSFSGGGAEKRFVNIATNLFEGKADIAVLVPVQKTSTTIKNNVFSLGWNGRLSYPKVIWLLRQRIKHGQYDVVMAFGLYPCVVSILAGSIMTINSKIVVSEITRPRMEAQNNNAWRTLAHNFLRKLLYKRCSLITANSIDGLSETCGLAGIPVAKGVRVVNVVDRINLLKESEKEIGISTPEGKYVICVGRIDYMKGLETVVNAFDILVKHIKCRLVIVGDGEARATLERQVGALGLREEVIFTGMLKNPYPLLKKAAAFILASEYEGFSNSVLEAMFCDVPVITSFCSTDAREMCELGAALGFEVGDYKQLAKHIATVVTDNQLGQRLVQRARDYRTPHAMENAIPFYEDLVCKVASDVLSA